MLLMAALAILFGPVFRVALWYRNRDQYRLQARGHASLEQASEFEASNSAYLDRYAAKVYPHLFAHPDVSDPEKREHWHDDHPRYGLTPMTFRPFEGPRSGWLAK